MTLEERVRSVRDVLERESAAWGRVPRLIAVTKYSTAEQILPLYDLGVTDIGENRVQAIREKLPALEGRFSVHLIGQLQSNKVKYLMGSIRLIHSVDRLSLAQEIERQADKHGIVQDILLEVNIGGEETRRRPVSLPAAVRGPQGAVRSGPDDHDAPGGGAGNHRGLFFPHAYPAGPVPAGSG